VASPPAPDVGLGAPGATAAPRKPAEPAAPDVGLGAPGRQPARPTPVPMAEDVSLSLSDHVEVRPDDVKEAVRQSRIMPAVELPKDLEEPAPLSRPPVSRPMEAAKPAEPAAPAMSSRSPEPVVRDRRHEAETVEAPPLVRDEMLAQAQRSRPMQAVVPEPEPVAKAPEPVKTPEPVVAMAPEPVAKAPEPVAKAPEAKPTQPVAKPPVELPKPPVVAEKQPVVPPAPRSGTSPALIILLVLVVLGVGGFLVWKYVLQNDASGPSADNTPAAAPVKPAEPPPPPPAPAGKVALVAPAPDDLKVAKAGSIENILDATHVAAGDVVIRLVGDRPIEAQLDTLRKDLGKLKDQLEAATKKRDAAAPATQAAADADVAARQKALDAKQAQISTKQSELDAFVITAPANGAFTPSGKAGQKVGASDVVGKLQRDALPSVTFKVADPKAFTASAPVTVVANHQPVSCTVADVAADSIKVACPADPMLTDGADVTLAVPAAGSAVPAGTEPPATGSGSGSDSAAPPTVGSAEAGAGSSK
ncbi:MAG TPA: hypothetical protein VFP84_18850, partial [Kofleriaceae bacterium]|nr:hypothetical protein [Kofleriaceae bacterium]